MIFTKTAITSQTDVTGCSL